MTAAQLVNKYPHLYHMAEDGSWPSIQEHGLLSTSALLTLYGYTGARRDALESDWRAEKVMISCPHLDDVVIRDQKPMPPQELQKCLLDGMSPSEWYRLINGRTFFWVQWNPSVEWFLGGREYRNKTQLMITVDTRGLLTRYQSEVTLSGMNSGSTYYSQERSAGPKPRGISTFRKLEKYDLPWVTELAVDHGVTDVAAITLSVARWISDGKDCRKVEDIWP